MTAPQRCCLVTGASSGIGAAICQRLLALGWQVVALSRRGAGDLNHPNLISHPIDLAQLQPLPQRLKALLKAHPEIDSLVLNAGQGRFGGLETFSERQIQDLIDLNLTSQILLARTLLPHLKRRGAGHLVFTGSEAALQGGRNGSLYCATKFALRGFAQSLREECSGSGVAVGIVNPGMVASPFFDNLNFAPGEQSDQHLTPEDVAEAVLLMLQARPGACIDEINLSPQKRVIAKKRCRE